MFSDLDNNAIIKKRQLQSENNIFQKFEFLANF